MSAEGWPTSIADAGAGLRSGAFSVGAITRHFLNGIHLLQPELNALIAVTEDLAIATAATLDAELRNGIDRGKLHGIPIVIKDDTDVAGYPTTVGSALYKARGAERVPERDATAAARLKAAGAVILGKTNMNEFAAGGKGGFNPHFGNTRNPWSLLHEPGGSSSGTGAAVAARLCLGGTGTDAGGSVRGPASRCGIVGIRPTYGRVSCRGTFPRCRSFGTVGPIANRVADAAALLTAMAGHDPGDPNSLDLPQEDFAREMHRGIGGLRLGLVDGFSFEGLDPEVAEALSNAVATFEMLGGQVKSVSAPTFSKTLDPARLAEIIFREFADVLADEYDRADPSLFGEIVHRDMANAHDAVPGRYDRLVAERKQYRRDAAELFADVDCLLTPVFPGMHADIDDPPDLSGDHRRFTVPVSYLGLPSVALPCGLSSNRLPIGMQIIGNWNDENLIVRVAAAFEASSGLQNEQPPILWTGPGI